MVDWIKSGEAVRKSHAADPQNRRYQDILKHGSMRVGHYALRESDPQKPHTQDEVYIVVKGTGEMVKNGERGRFEPGSVIFVEAGATHKFENFSPDFETWVVFWGPEGGEK